MVNILTLHDDVARVQVVPQLGGGLARFDVRRGGGWLPVLRPWSEREEDGPFALANNILAPWSNRISGGGFAFEGTFHALEPNFPGEPYPLHGNAFQQPWEVVDHQPHSVHLRLRAQGPAPFVYQADLHYTLNRGALRSALTLRNLASMRLPYGAGFHPWFVRNGELLLQAPATHYWSEAPDHLPIARLPCFASEYDFNNLRAFPDSWINSAFEGWSGHASLHYPMLNYGVAISASPNLPAFMLYSPSTVSPFVCFDPISHVPDAHHLDASETGAPLHVLAAEEELSCWMQLQVMPL